MVEALVDQGNVDEAMLLPLLLSPDSLSDREREEARLHRDQGTLELAAAGAARTLEAGHSATQAFAQAAHHDQGRPVAGPDLAKGT